MDYFNPNPYGFLSPCEVANVVEGRTSCGTHVDVRDPFQAGPRFGPAPLELPQRELLPLESRGNIYEGRTPDGSHIDMRRPIELPPIKSPFEDDFGLNKRFCIEPEYPRKKLFGDDPLDCDLANPFRVRGPYDY